MTDRDIIARLAQGDKRFDMIDSKMDQVLAMMTDLQNDMAKVKADAAETKEIVEAWSTVKNVGKFIKWAGALATAIAGIGAVFIAFVLLIKAAIAGR
ncbi:MAG: hypothetical protein U5M50_04200 [Sphingobium sp.]|nr:hypothetical protein [Sphingobium sp.]